MRILVFGARGMLGTDILKEWRSDELIAVGSSDADIRDAGQVRRLVEQVRPDWIILAAAYTDVDGSERNREMAFAVNETGAKNVAAAARGVGAAVLYVSTDYVFDGTATVPYEIDDPIRPLNVYGASKAAGEQVFRESQIAWCICRTSWLFGVSGPSFPGKILKAAETRPELTVVSDQVGSPTYTRDLAAAIRDLVRNNAKGIVHVTNEGSCSWFDFAREILSQAGLDKTRIEPISTKQAARLASRPAFSVLSSASLRPYGIRMRSWQAALNAYLKELGKNA